ncbi:hypothetical protein [Aquitalea magnusonii]|jgi:hypothetical protein|uniref:Uncharacterized protein n=1 Tax=Aquitalea magnusonii TaxID=332411 RepID=A0A318JG97_9NEIS|nr:hypothetical protein [Aquitalea magnusonii]PXX49400.1 hypothetical protein DFR38_10440 [Aquitalea magnusonii]
MKTILITGDKPEHKLRAAKVAMQIAEQHHGVRAEVTGVSDYTANKYGLKPAPGLGKPLIKIVVAGSETQGRGRGRADKVINMAAPTFAKHPNGRSVTFALREAVDHCLASA